MKNRLLPCCFSALLLGFSLFLLSNLSFAAGPEKTQGTDRLQKMRVNQVTGTVDPSDVMKARQQAEKLSTKSTASGLGLNWQSMGPINFQGRSRVVIFDNKDASGLTMYTGGVTGGIWKSTNQGLTWVPANTESENVLNVTAMTQQPSGTIFVGTGETYCGSDYKMGTGIYKSDDGTNFYLIPGAAPVANDPSTDWAYIKKLTVDPNSGRVFAITNLGIRYSDNGNDWFTVRNGNASDIVIGTDGFIMIAVNDSVFISPNGNLTSFFNVSTNTATTLPTDNVGKIEFAIAPSDPNIMYVSIAKESDGFMLNVYRTADKGATWSVIFPNNPTFEPFGGVGCTANTLAVLPGDPNQIILGGYNCWYGKQVAPTGYFNWEMVSEGLSNLLGNFFVPYDQYDMVFDPADPNKFAIATDNGITIGTISSSGFDFQTTNKNLLTSQMNSVAYTIYQNALMGGGQSVGMQVIGALQSNDPRAGVDLFAPLDWVNGTYCEWSMINPNVVFYGTDAGTEPYTRSDDLGRTPSPTFLGGIASTITSNLPIAYWESFDYENTRDSVVYRSGEDTITAGETIYPTSVNQRYKFPYICPVNMLPGDSVTVPDLVQSRFFIYGTKNKSGVFMTKEALIFSKDPAWYQLGETDPLTCMTLSNDLNYLWGGTADGKIYRISNIALAHDSATADMNSPTCIVASESFSIPEFSGRYITSIAISPDDDNTVMVTLGNYGNDKYVYLTENALDSVPTFASVQGDLPATPVFSSIFEMHGGNKAIIGTDMGVYATDNILSGSWTADYSGLGNVPVTMLRQQTMNYFLVQNYGTLYAASYGSGFFIDNTFYTPLGSDPVTVDNSKASLKVVPNPAKDRVNVTYKLDHQSNVTLALYDLTGRVVMQKSLGTQSRGDHNTVVDLSGLNTGTYVLKVNDAHAKVVKIQ